MSLINWIIWCTGVAAWVAWICLTGYSLVRWAVTHIKDQRAHVRSMYDDVPVMTADDVEAIVEHLNKKSEREQAVSEALSTIDHVGDRRWNKQHPNFIEEVEDLHNDFK